MQRAAAGSTDSLTPSASAGRRVISGGITAYNDEHRIAHSIRSLLSQELPPDTEWGRIWVVASGCTDRTVEIARSIAAREPRVELLIEPQRRGKAAAIREVLRRAEGDFLVLLNSDAAAAPGSVAALLAKGLGRPSPFAVMARPTVPQSANGGWSDAMRWMWDFHHELHVEMLRNGRGSHLSDELLLVTLPATRWIESGVINDGSYFAVWLQDHFGHCWYAPEAEVAIDVPNTPKDHLRQRRRIHFGNSQVAARLGRYPTTAIRYFFEEPSRALLALRRALARERGFRHLVRIACWEVVAHALAIWDRLPPRHDHVLWSRIAAPAESGGGISVAAERPSSVATNNADDRIRVLLDVARQFGTGIPLPQLVDLLPTGAVEQPEQLEAHLATQPHLARLMDKNAFAVTTPTPRDPDRTDRGARYRRAAEALVRGPLAWLARSVRAIGITGSAAYGEPAAGDDLDFFVVARAGALSWFLAGVYLTLRLRKLRGEDAATPAPCFNYVVDERRAPAEFAGGQGLLFAREALTAQILVGDDYYRGLLAETPWMAAELPRLYSARSTNAGDTSVRAAPLVTRLASAALFLPLAAYLQLAGLRRNALARRSRRDSEVFRTLTSPDRVAFQSRRFEALRAQYDSPPTIPSDVGGTAPSGVPTA